MSDPLKFKAPSVEYVWAASAPNRAYFRPKFVGLENIDPKRKTLFAGNHTLFGIDGSVMLAKIYKEKGLFVRALGDKMHFQVPGWRTMLTRFGVVNATRENCARLMEAGAPILVYPGGGREVLKRKGEEYQLIWKNRTGFARLAVEHGYDILPFAAVGGDDAFEILADANDFMKHPIGKLALKVPAIKALLRDGDVIPPLVAGAGPLPKRVRFYFSFGRPIRTTPYAGKQDDAEAMLELRGKVERSIRRQLKALLALRDKDSRKRPK